MKLEKFSSIERKIKAEQFLIDNSCNNKRINEAKAKIINLEKKLSELKIEHYNNRMGVKHREKATSLLVCQHENKLKKDDTEITISPLKHAPDNGLVLNKNVIHPFVLITNNLYIKKLAEELFKYGI